MPFTVTCPKCGTPLQAPDAAAGRQVLCKACGQTFLARRPPPGPAGGPPPVPKPARRPTPIDEAEDPPRRLYDEDGPPPKRTGLPVLPLVFLIVGGMVVLCGGLVAGAYFLGTDRKAPTAAAAAKDTRPEEPPPPAPKPAPKESADGWVEQHDAAGRYRVRFPREPQAATQPSAKLDGSPADLTIYTLALDGETFQALHIPLPENFPLTKEQLLSTYVDAYAGAGPEAVQRSKSTITYQTYPGREVVVERGPKKEVQVVRAILAGNRVLVLIAGGPAAAPDAPRVKKFFESLKIE